MNKTIYRINTDDGNWGYIGFKAANDKNISGDAFHFLFKLLNNIEEWTIRVDATARHLGWKRDRKRSAIKKLVDNGYMRYWSKRKPDGTIEWFYVLHEQGELAPTDGEEAVVQESDVRAAIDQKSQTSPAITSNGEAQNKPTFKENERVLPTDPDAVSTDCGYDIIVSQQQPNFPDGLFDAVDNWEPQNKSIRSDFLSKYTVPDSALMTITMIEDFKTKLQWINERAVPKSIIEELTECIMDEDWWGFLSVVKDYQKGVDD